MPAPIVFYFDFASPYGYFASTRIDAIGAKYDRPVDWRTFFMRVIVSQKMGMTRSLVDEPIKGPYVRHDIQRMARYFGLPLNPANLANFNPLLAERAFLFIKDQDEDMARIFAKRVYRRLFAEATDMTAIDAIAALSAEIGADRAAVCAAIESPVYKERLKLETEKAAERGVWGTPTVDVDGELFWGSDRLALVDEWLARGGW